MKDGILSSVIRKADVMGSFVIWRMVDRVKGRYVFIPGPGRRISLRIVALLLLYAVVFAALVGAPLFASQAGRFVN